MTQFLDSKAGCMNLGLFWQFSSLTLALVGAAHAIAPSAQAHHDPIHSAEETVTRTVASPDTTMPLALGSSLLLGVAAAGSYYVFKRRSI
ncbi:MULTISPECIES: hypothetical protein [Trichocoleus]|uniref:LPXTG cell wall anchor domain-containing protein n=1 Tax=Trichocoleus desertorum GB2-A4 TaxID=2933944 RepID=A0ABV0J5L6_9CYAN|nr:hypothetical protein [Trichocoleus sp. FACHB-46]MBD1863919.1 hypothetical protein [Trichocoleus sp. FACHB-46]